MTDRREEDDLEVPPTPRARERARRLTPFWILPVLAAALVVYLLSRAIAEHGPTITVRFETADGLRVEQTQVKYKAVTLGTVEGIELSDDAGHVIVSIKMDARARPLLTEQARFWVVRPRLSMSDVAALETGLETLVTGAYISIDPGEQKGPRQDHFVGLERPPLIRGGVSGTTFVLRSHELGAINVGSQIRHRNISVGEVLAVDLDDKTGAAAVEAFVHAPYDRMVVQETRFWVSSGVHVGMGAQGLRIDISSLRTLLSGGIEFRTPEGPSGPPAAPGAVFELLPSEAIAEIELYGNAYPCVAYFDSSVQGLGRGSPVSLLGMQVGNVTGVSMVPGPGAGDALRARVELKIQPERALAREHTAALQRDALRTHVARGLRVVLDTTSYLTGEKALALKYVQGDAPTAVELEDGVMVLPTRSQDLGSIVEQVSGLATRLNGIPFEQIGRSLGNALRGVERAVGGPEAERAVQQLTATLKEVEALAAEARAGLTPALERLPGIAARIDEAVDHANAALATLDGRDGKLQRDMQRMLEEVANAARSIRLLADTLEKNPEALLRGKPTETKK